MNTTAAGKQGRARAMPVEDRRAMIAAAAIPLFVEQGASVTTRELADHLGIAEGTIFRAFGDKDALVQAVIDAFFDQTHQILTPELDDPDLSLAARLHILISNARAHVNGIFVMLSLLDPSEAHEYMKQRSEGRFEEAAAAAFSTDAADLNIPPERLGALIRLIVIAASAPGIGGGARLSDAELVDFALYGIAGRPWHDETASGSGRTD